MSNTGTVKMLTYFRFNCLRLTTYLRLVSITSTLDIEKASYILINSAATAKRATATAQKETASIQLRMCHT